MCSLYHNARIMFLGQKCSKVCNLRMNSSFLNVPGICIQGGTQSFPAHCMHECQCSYIIYRILVPVIERSYCLISNLNKYEPQLISYFAKLLIFLMLVQPCNVLRYANSHTQPLHCSYNPISHLTFGCSGLRERYEALLEWGKKESLSCAVYTFVIPAYRFHSSFFRSRCNRS